MEGLSRRPRVHSRDGTASCGSHGGYRAQLTRGRAQSPALGVHNVWTSGTVSRHSTAIGHGRRIELLDEETIRALRGIWEVRGSASTQVSHVELLERNPGEFQEANILGTGPAISAVGSAG